MSIQHHISGLTEEQVTESRRLHGPNLLTPPARTPLWKQFLQKFKDPMIIILLVAGALSLGISCYEYWGRGEDAGVFFEPAGILIAILLATGLAFYFELRANREFDLLNQVSDDEPVQVIRENSATSIPRKDVVVGDIVILNTGEEVPADGELLEAVHLGIDESSLTGEPICHKTTDPDDFDPEATFPSNHALKGTKVMEGHGIMRVTAVGDATENGKVFEAARIDSSVKTPLNEQLERLGALISKISYGLALLIVIGRVMLYFMNVPFDWITFSTSLLQTLMIAVTLVVVAVPEGLPMAVTLSLAYSMRRMLQTNNLVRRMHACETMGATTVICTDKTGTLTQNQMRVYRTDFFGNPPAHVLYEGIAVNSTAQLDLSDSSRPQALGNPTEGALLLWLHDNETDYRQLKEKVTVTEELPFSTERKYMATVVRSSDGSDILYVKGAPEIIFGLCTDTAGVTEAELNAQLLAYQNQAMRTLGFAYQVLRPGDRTIENGKVVAEHLVFLGFVAISDPVRADVPDAVREVIRAG
ncbi:MAG: HAD-IC family P-type ATPase, partial [Muribaculaceae bacterium]|nr:HAD-IC family P-type ATPase [Muribaculaceae bacterium]